jgi:hypothetical protein
MVEFKENLLGAMNAGLRTISRRVRIAKRVIRHFRKMAFKRPDISWGLFQFERSVNPLTWDRHDEIAEWALSCSQNSDPLEQVDRYETSEDPVVRQGYALMHEVKQRYKGRFSKQENVRILVHLPSWGTSPGGYSVYSNLLQALEFIGVPVMALEWDQPVEPLLESFRPTVFITSDHDSYLKRIKWDALATYRKRNLLNVGLTASLEEYGNTPLPRRLEWAKKNHINFYYSFRSPEYLERRKEYQLYYERGYRIYSIEFGANPLTYYPVPGFKRDINYAFLASTNPDKWARYSDYLTSIFRRYPGFIDGPGWSMIGNFKFNANRDRYIYSRAKIGINLHIENQVNQASELNERTYMLAACGVPQLIDNPMLLNSRFTPGCFFTADDPRDYEDLFDDLIRKPEMATTRTLQAQREVFEKHTTLQRAERFVLDLVHEKGSLN